MLVPYPLLLNLYSPARLQRASAEIRYRLRRMRELALT